MMKIKIVKSALSSYWYSNHIGETFDAEPRFVTPTMQLDYRVLNNGHFVEMDDCQVVEL